MKRIEFYLDYDLDMDINSWEFGYVLTMNQLEHNICTDTLGTFQKVMRMLNEMPYVERSMSLDGWVWAFRDCLKVMPNGNE